MMKCILSFVIVLSLSACTGYSPGVIQASERLQEHRSVAAQVNTITVSANALGRGGLVGPMPRHMVCFRHYHMSGQTFRLCTPERKWESLQRPDFFTFLPVTDGLLMQTFYDANPHGSWDRWRPHGRRHW